MSKMKNLNILILEDDHERHRCFRANLEGNNVFIVETSKEAIDQLAKKEWDILFLDHDLGGEQMVDSGKNTGYEVACWLEEFTARKPKLVIVHSFNPTGAKKMCQALPEAHYLPGAWTRMDSVEEIVEYTGLTS